MVKVFRPKAFKKRKRSTEYTWKQKQRRVAVPRTAGTMTQVRGSDYGFPDKLRTRLRYCDTFSVNASTSAYVFRLNSLYDPDLSGVGHQPTYFDQLCGAAGSGIYGKYRVLGSKITVTYTSRSPPALAVSNTSPALVYLAKDQDSTLTYTTASNVMEQSGNYWKVLQDKAGSNNVVKLSCTYSPNRDLGYSVGDDTIAAAYNANPGQQLYAIVGKIDQGPATGDVQLYVEIEYYAEFFQRNEMNTS